MSPQPLEDRVDRLERRVSVLEQLPARIDSLESQIVLLRTEMREEFSAIRTELRAEIRAGDEETKRFMRVLHEEVLDRIARLGEGLAHRSAGRKPKGARSDQ